MKFESRKSLYFFNVVFVTQLPSYLHLFTKLYRIRGFYGCEFQTMNTQNFQRLTADYIMSLCLTLIFYPYVQSCLYLVSHFLSSCAIASFDKVLIPTHTLPSQWDRQNSEMPSKIPAFWCSHPAQSPPFQSQRNM